MDSYGAVLDIFPEIDVIENYVSDYGIGIVEDVIDACLANDDISDQDPSRIRELREYLDQINNNFWTQSYFRKVVWDSKAEDMFFDEKVFHKNLNLIKRCSGYYN